MIMEITSSGSRIADASLFQEFSLNLNLLDGLVNGQSISITTGSGVITAQKVNLRYHIKFHKYTTIEGEVEKTDVSSYRSE